MAVYQISRIQIRRGQANQGTGLPQLASGEMAWAVDTQELYIGSGAVSEGAPAVGNVKILTSVDLADGGNILATLGYTYQANSTAIQTGSTATAPVVRSIASRLDDQVNFLDFVTAANVTSGDYTAALQRAIFQLFLNTTKASGNSATAIASRVTLNIPAGTYNISSTIYIPSFASIVGAGTDKTIINYVPQTFTFSGTTTNGTANLLYASASTAYLGYTVSGTGIVPGTIISSASAGVSFGLSQTATVSGTNSITLTAPYPAFQFINDSSTIGNIEPVQTGSGSAYQPRSIILKDLSVYTTSGANTLLQLNSVKDSIFENMVLSGGWNGNTSVGPVYSTGITMSVVTSLISTEHNIFRNIKFTGFQYGVYSAQVNSVGSDIINNNFSDCYLTNCLIGFYLGVGYSFTTNFPYGPRQTHITLCKFYLIANEAIYFAAGTTNIVRDCAYRNVGNALNNNSLSQYPQVYFATYGNSTSNDQSDRHSDLAYPGNGIYSLVPYVPEVSGHAVYTLSGNRTINLSQTTSAYVPILKLPLPWLPNPSDRTSGPTGSISYNINYTYVSTLANNAYCRYGTIHVTADVAGKTITLSDEYDYTNTVQTYATALDFKAQLTDSTGTVTTISPWNILISYQNLTANDNGTFTYSYTASF
jgi:hypothetical protein